jgi:hypothetical protein
MRVTASQLRDIDISFETTEITVRNTSRVVKGVASYAQFSAAENGQSRRG